jgi:trans-aconitate methyltransferase
MTEQLWDASLYDTQHAFVASFGNDLLDLLGAQPGERILDLGCGTGEHVAKLLAQGAEATGVDSSAEMIARAQEKQPGLPVSVGDARTLPYSGELDGVFSNAVLHWVPEAASAAAAVAQALRPGGRFVAEFGGAGNIATLLAGAASMREQLGAEPVPDPWYFPTIGEYASVLETAGLQVSAAWLYDRPTRLAGEHGLATWIRMFGRHLLGGLHSEESFLAGVESALRPVLWRDGAWWADYRRIRVVALKPA